MARRTANPPKKSATKTKRKRSVGSAKSGTPGKQAATPTRAVIEVRGASHHNLKNIDIDIPLNQLTVVTGLSGSGKSTLAFDTLYAEGQRRYVETFSPYTRQFLDRMDKPEVERINGIPPAIAIEQSNQVKSSRSTVGTMTEIADYLKMLFPRLARLRDDKHSYDIRPHSAQEITELVLRDDALANGTVYVVFAVPFPARTRRSKAFDFLKSQGFLRVLIDGQSVRTDDETKPKAIAPRELLIIQDRLNLGTSGSGNRKDAGTARSRLTEAVEAALRHGSKGVVRVVLAEDVKQERRFANSWLNPYTGEVFEAPKPSLFSFNNPVGACPRCRGFGRVIEIDYMGALPDRTLSIRQGVVKPWAGDGVNAECQKDLLKHAKRQGVNIDKPFFQLAQKQQDWVIYGDVGKLGEEKESLHDVWERGGWYGVKGFFDWLETKTYKMHVRVMLARYRAYRTCPVCRGQRFQPGSLRWKIDGPEMAESSERSGASKNNALCRAMSLADINRMPLREALRFFEALPMPAHDEAARQLHREIVARLGYLIEVGLGYLTLDRSTRTLSGGEVMRVNLTSCLGNSLVNTLFVLDEPSIGLHQRDTDQLVRVIERLRDRGNTVVVVEHEEAIMRRADHILDLGPGRGEHGGEVVFAGDFDALLRDKRSLTGKYLSGTKIIPLPTERRPVVLPNVLDCAEGKRTTKKKATAHPHASNGSGGNDGAAQISAITLRGARRHNLKSVDVSIPLRRFVVVTGVSGSGKSTLVHDVLYQEVRRAKNLAADDGGDVPDGAGEAIDSITGAEQVAEVVRVDQAPLAKTPRSNPALYLGAYNDIRKLFAATPAALAQGVGTGDFSFNTGAGRCTRCAGTGLEKIEMQFLADVFMTCPICEGRRFQKFLLDIHYRGKSIHDVLEMTIAEARAFFDPEIDGLTAPQKKSHASIARSMALLSDVGLDYLRLGQPLSHLSGGEAQRVKLLSYLKEARFDSASDLAAEGTRLFILDEPTTGLHFEDIRLLINLLQRLVDQGDSLVVIEHNLEIIKCADWVIDLGPDAGDLGGEILAVGTPEQLAGLPAL